MGVEIRLPNITGKTEKEQLLQLKSYLYQLSEQLQWAFDNINTTGGSSENSGYVVSQPRSYSPASTNADPQATFATLKSLIIKSADIVDAYYEEINKKLVGIYVAQSDFGAYEEQTALQLEATSKNITQNYENTQILITGAISDANAYTDSVNQEIAGSLEETNNAVGNLSDGLDSANSRIGSVESKVESARTELNEGVQEALNSISTVDGLRLAAEQALQEGLQSVGSQLTALTGIILEENGIVTIGTTGTIKCGHLYTNSAGVAVYGLEVGQSIEINGTEVYSKIARLTSQGLYFFNPQSYDTSLSDEENAVAYISDKKLYIGHAEILTSFKIGYLADYVMANGDVITKWEGVSG